MSKIKEKCGLAAAINLDNASRYVYDCLALMQHRGEASVGIVSNDGAFSYRRRIGKVMHQFGGYDFSKLPGAMSTGHNRYATSGSPGDITDIQPLIVKKSKFGMFTLAHNGTLAHTSAIEENLIGEGVTFQSSTDSELLIKLITRKGTEDIITAIIESLKEIKAAYSLLIQTNDKIIAVRDKFGVRPLSIGKIKKGYLVASETYVFDQFPECDFVRDVHPGEIVVFEKGKESFTSIQYAQQDEAFCVFEGIYFSNPRSMYKGSYHEDFRKDLGRQLYNDNNIQADIIIPILDSGKMAAIGVALESGIPYEEAFLRIHDPPRSNNRSFTSPTQKERIQTAHMKLNLRKSSIKGKDVLVVDDSLVRSNTLKVINQRLREAGAKSIINFISAPPIINICQYGMDFQNKEELAAHNYKIEQIAEKIDADKLVFQSLKGLKKCVKKNYNCGVCSGCFGGKYPINQEN